MMELFKSLLLKLFCGNLQGIPSQHTFNVTYFYPHLIFEKDLEPTLKVELKKELYSVKTA